MSSIKIVYIHQSTWKRFAKKWIYWTAVNRDKAS